MEKVRWGILGPGKIANRFANDFQYVDNAVLAAVASRSDERGKAFANKYEIPSVYCSYEDLYQDPNVDAIYVATPHNFHFEQTKKAIEAGKAVLCEKPITISENQLTELIKVATENKTFLAEGMWTYFLPAIQTVKKWVEEGKIGKVTNIKSNFGFKADYNPEERLFNPALAGGALFDIGIYNIAISWLLLKEEPAEMSILEKRAKTGVDEELQMLFQYKNGVVANHHCSIGCDFPNVAYIIGEKGYITVPDFWKASEAHLFIEKKLVHAAIFKDDGFGFNHEISTVSQDILDKKLESEIVSHEDSLAFQKQMSKVGNKTF